MTEDIEVGRYSQAAPHLAAEFKEEKDTPMEAEEKKRQQPTQHRHSSAQQLPTATHQLTSAPLMLLFDGCLDVASCCSAQWQYALTALDLLPESDTVLLWLARLDRKSVV